MATYTLVHVVISLVGIAAGFVVLHGFLTHKERNHWTELFLTTTVLTSVTGFGFPATHVTPAHVFGVISLAVLAVAIYARYARHAEGRWAQAYVINSTIAQYLNFFVLIVQSFQKVPALNALAPTQSELPFAATQLVTLVAFVVIGTLATYRFRAESTARLAHAKFIELQSA